MTNSKKTKKKTQTYIKYSYTIYKMLSLPLKKEEEEKKKNHKVNTVIWTKPQALCDDKET